jgi:hypothetical protein
MRRFILGSLRRITIAAWRLVRPIADFIAECDRAQRRMFELRFSSDRYLPSPGEAPSTYQEFLYRTSGPLRHEPPAHRRSAGQPVR